MKLHTASEVTPREGTRPATGCSPGPLTWRRRLVTRSIACFTVALSLPGWPALGQGTLNFANGAAGVEAAVTFAESGSGVEGPEWQAQLLLVGADGTTRPVGESVVFQSGSLGGYFFAGLVTVPDMEAGAQATFRVRAFSTNTAVEAFSSPVQVILGGGKMPPPNLVGLEAWSVSNASFRLNAELSGDQVVLWWSNQFPDVVLESTPELAPVAWSNVDEPRIVEGDSIQVTLSAAAQQRYFRLRR